MIEASATYTLSKPRTRAPRSTTEPSAARANRVEVDGSPFVLALASAAKPFDRPTSGKLARDRKTVRKCGAVLLVREEPMVDVRRTRGIDGAQADPAARLRLHDGHGQ